MVTKKNLEKGKRYIYFYSVPRFVTYIGKKIVRKMSSLQEEAEFKDDEGRELTPRLTNIYNIESIKSHTARLMIESLFKA